MLAGELTISARNGIMKVDAREAVKESKKSNALRLMSLRVLNAKRSVRQPHCLQKSGDHQKTTDHVCESSEAHRPKSWSSFLHIKDTPTCARLLLTIVVFYPPSAANLKKIWQFFLLPAVSDPWI
jgi:hypothetical protein